MRWRARRHVHPRHEGRRARLPCRLAVGAPALLVLLTATPSYADPRQPFELDPIVDPAILMSAGLTWLLPELFKDELVTTQCVCDAREVNGLDRGVTELRDARIARVSDVAVGAIVALPLALGALDVGMSSAPWKGIAADGAVVLESVLASGAVNQLTKLAVHRPRPLLYATEPDAAERREPDNYLSFYSAHTSTAFAASIAYASVFAARHPRSPWRFAVYGGAVALGAGVGTMRVLAGKHFITDVLVGAAAGSALGVLVPWLHRTTPVVGSVAPLRGGATASLIVAF